MTTRRRWPDRAELHERMHVVRIPLRTRFRDVEVREAALFEGPAGWGEFAPFLEYPPAEAARWLDAAVEAAWTGWPRPVRAQIPVNATMPAVRPDQVAEVLARYDGCRTVKVKVAQRGQSLAQDLARVGAVRDLLGPAGRVRVDANGGWDIDQARDALTALRAYDLEYAEQPCATVPELATLRVELARAGVEVRVAADESIRRADDSMAVVRAGAADIVVVKVAPLGGVAAALRIAEDCGLPAVVSSALDTSVGIAAGLALAAALPRLDHDCGLATVELLVGDVADPSLVPRDGAIAVGPATISRALVDSWKAPTGCERWWRERLDQTLTHSWANRGL